MKTRTNLPVVCTRCEGPWTQELDERQDVDDPTLYVGAKRCTACGLKYVYSVWRDSGETQPHLEFSA